MTSLCDCCLQNRDPRKTSTREVWPWSLLVPWMEAELLARAAAIRAPRAGAEGTPAPPPLDPYNNPLAMPLAEFLDAPIVADLLHNGAALQVLSLCRCFRMVFLRTGTQWLVYDGCNTRGAESNVLAWEACEGCATAAAQVLGVTNYSQWAGAAEVRGCMAASEAARGALQVLFSPFSIPKTLLSSHGSPTWEV